MAIFRTFKRLKGMAEFTYIYINVNGVRVLIDEFFNKNIFSEDDLFMIFWDEKLDDDLSFTCVYLYGKEDFRVRQSRTWSAEIPHLQKISSAATPHKKCGKLHK